MAQSIEGPDGDEQGSSPDPDVIPDDEELGPAFSGSTLSGRQESLSSAKVVPSGDDGDETGSPAETDETDGEEETEN